MGNSSQGWQEWPCHYSESARTGRTGVSCCPVSALFLMCQLQRNGVVASIVWVQGYFLPLLSGAALDEPRCPTEG